MDSNNNIRHVYSVTFASLGYQLEGGRGRLNINSKVKIAPKIFCRVVQFQLHDGSCTRIASILDLSATL